MFNHYQNTQSTSNILCFIWKSTIDHPRNSLINRDNKRKRRGREIYFALSQSTENVSIFYSNAVYSSQGFISIHA